MPAHLPLLPTGVWALSSGAPLLLPYACLEPSPTGPPGRQPCRQVPRVDAGTAGLTEKWLGACWEGRGLGPTLELWAPQSPALPQELGSPAGHWPAQGGEKGP